MEEKQLEIQIQRAIELSLTDGAAGGAPPTQPVPPKVEANGSAIKPTEDKLVPEGLDDDLARALKLSEKESAEKSKREEEEDEIMKKILELSMTEK